MQPTLSTSLLESLSEMLAARTGLHFPSERWADLERGIVAAAPLFGMPDPQSCALWLLSSQLTRSQIEVLASQLTVGETYFFRESRSFEALEQQVLPKLLQVRAKGERRLRFWSAGCCTGEEAYSIAMLVDRLIPQSGDWNVSILATDINPAFLRKAAEGVYGEWSFRDTPAWIRARYFRQGMNSRFELKPSIRRRVDFSYLNLADDIYPSLVNNTNAMDVIFCRNVLMYFSAAQAKRVVEKLHRSLVEGGWLIISPAESSTSLLSSFTAVDFAGTVLYRKTSQTRSPTGATPFPAAERGLSPETGLVDSRAVDPTLDSALPAAARSADQAVAPPAETAASEVDASPAPSCMARLCANQGKLAEALHWGEKAIALDKLDPANQFLLATIQQELGQADAAARSLTIALYIDPEFVLAHFALGNLCLAQGRRHEAERHFDNSLMLLHARPRDEALSEADGLTAGRLMEIITSIRSGLPRARVSA